MRVVLNRYPWENLYIFGTSLLNVELQSNELLYLGQQLYIVNYFNYLGKDILLDLICYLISFVL